MARRDVPFGDADSRYFAVVKGLTKTRAPWSITRVVKIGPSFSRYSSAPSASSSFFLGDRQPGVGNGLLKISRDFRSGSKLTVKRTQPARPFCARHLTYQYAAVHGKLVPIPDACIATTGVNG